MGDSWHVTETHSPGSAVRRAREALGLTQDDLAKFAGLERTHLSNLERGKNAGTGGELRAGLAQGFGVVVESVVELLEGRISVDEFTKRARPGRPPSSPPTPAPTQAVVYDDAYANRRTAVEAVRRALQDAERIANAEGDRPVEWWLEKIAKLAHVRAESERRVHALVEGDDGFDVRPSIPAKVEKGRKR